MSPTQLYRFFDIDDQLIYVGIANDAWKRHSQHLASSPWAKEIVRVTIEDHPTRGAAVDAEARAIVSESPKYNKAGRRPPTPATFDEAADVAKVEAWLSRERAAP